MPGLDQPAAGAARQRGGGDLRREHLRSSGRRRSWRAIRCGRSSSRRRMSEQTFAARGGTGSSLWRLSGRARDQHGHGGGSGAAGCRHTSSGDHAPDRGAGSGDGPRRVSAGRARGPGRAVPVRDGPGDEVRRRGRLPRRRDDAGGTDGGGAGIDSRCRCRRPPTTTSGRTREALVEAGSGADGRAARADGRAARRRRFWRWRRTQRQRRRMARGAQAHGAARRGARDRRQGAGAGADRR